MCVNDSRLQPAPACVLCVAADREELQQWAEEEAEQEAEQEEMLDSPAKRQRREEGSAFNYRSVSSRQCSPRWRPLQCATSALLFDSVAMQRAAGTWL